MQISDLDKLKNPYSLMGPLILTNVLIIFDALHQKENYCLLPNNKEKKIHTAIIQNKDTNKHTKSTPFSLSSNVFQCYGRCPHATTVYWTLPCVPIQYLGDKTAVSLGVPQFYDNLLLLTLGQKRSDYQPLGGRWWKLAVYNVHFWVCTTIIETNVNAMRS